MAEKKKRPKSATATPAPGKAATGAPEKTERVKSRDGALLTRSTDRAEYRFSPTNSGAAALSILAMSLGALAVGAGVYGKFIRTAMNAGTESHPWATYLLVGGAVLFGAAAFLGAMPASPVRVGDAGVAVEKNGNLDRLAWYEMTSLSFDGGVLTVRGAGKAFSLPVKAHLDAVMRIATEAKRRVPNKADLGNVPAGTGAAGEKLALEPDQLAGSRCAASDRIISLEKDGRLCGRCGQRYHKDSVPPRCVSCEAKL
jgi:hypothetical protein